MIEPGPTRDGDPPAATGACGRPYAVSQNDETTNTVWWEVYRRTIASLSAATT